MVPCQPQEVQQGQGQCPAHELGQSLVYRLGDGWMKSPVEKELDTLVELAVG